MQLSIHPIDQAAVATAPLELPDAIFGCPLNEPLVHQVVTAYLAGARSGTKAQKTRSQVRGGGIKPWRQKGTGRARAGSIRSPIWRGGGVTFAATPRNYAQKVNRKMYQQALCVIVSELLRQDRLKVVDSFTVSKISTKELAQQLTQLQLKNVLIVMDLSQPNAEQVLLSARNLPHVDICDVAQANPVSLIAYEQVLFTVDSLQKMQERLA